MEQTRGLISFFHFFLLLWLYNWATAATIFKKGRQKIFKLKIYAGMLKNTTRKFNNLFYVLLIVILQNVVFPLAHAIKDICFKKLFAVLLNSSIKSYKNDL